jgi:prolyl-tRNA editing enzyme YbaK/EbsC (Cys-tRNA(Pro) deacylase)
MAVVESNDFASAEDRERVERTRRIIEEAKLDAKILWHDVRGATTADAFASLGVAASDIAKSILFIAKDSSPHMVIILGDRRVDDRKLKSLVGSAVRIARPDEVLRHTGTEVGGVSPLGCDSVPKYVDSSLLGKEWVHASAGSCYATLLIRTKELITFLRAPVMDLAKN